MVSIIIAIDDLDNRVWINNVQNWLTNIKVALDEVVLLHVIQLSPEFLGNDVGPQHERDWKANNARKIHSKLQDISRAYKEQGIKARAVLREGPIVENILTEAESLHAALIIVGTHNRGLIESAILGNSVNRISKRLRTPLLLVPDRYNS